MNAANAHARDRQRWVKYARGTEATGGRSLNFSPAVKLMNEHHQTSA